MLRAMNQIVPLLRCLLAFAAAAAILVEHEAFAQSGFAANPQTNLGPINSAPRSFTPGQSGAFPSNSPYLGSSGGLAPTTNPSFDPYATNPSANGFGGSSFGGATVTPLGPPTPVGPPSFSSGPSSFGAPSAFGAPAPNATVGGNPAYPNGSLLGGLFSGNWFRGNTASAGTFQGAGFPAPTGPLIPFGNTPAAGAQYSAPSIYGGAPPINSQLGGNQLGTANVYGSGPMLNSPGGFGNSTAFPPSAYPSGSPTSLFPGGLSGNGGFGGAGLFPSGLFPAGGLGGYRLLNGPRLRHTFISGADGAGEVGMNQTDVSLGFAFGNFLYSNRPLYVVPSFSLYLFDGPTTTANSPADLPGSAYGGFLDFGWQTDPNQIIGGELGVRVGAYSDFDTFNDDSIRIMGKGLVSFRLTPTSTLKAGVYYLDRQSIKLLPAGGLLWQPNPFTRFDIFFPEPKFARYWRTVGTQDTWWYLAGEFGGDSWTVTRASSLEERVDINQIGVTFGFEWGRSEMIRTGQRQAFIEAGVVFDREIRYEISNDDRDLDEAFILRAGWGY